jgi:multisubunit Na+/H+ antiporter MnhB subunit
MIKKVTIFILVVLFVFIVLSVDLTKMDYSSKEYYLENTLNEVYSRNIVTGIYLDYRLFDSIFEAGSLLVSVAGVIFMAKKDETMRKG